MKHRVLMASLAAALALGACKPHAQGKPEAMTPAPAASAPQPTAATAAPAPDAAPAFDLASVPISAASLGAFPYFSLPQGYEAQNTPVAMDFTRFPFWTGDRLEWVEGKSYETGIVAAEGKAYSQYELHKNIEALIAAAGGVEITRSRIPKDQLDALEDDVLLGHNAGLGDAWNQPVRVFVIRRADRDIWVHYSDNSASAAWLILESAPFQATAGLLPASALKQQIDASGKAAIEVHFDSDRADILPDSQPQIAQVVALLQQETALRLSVNGHTDASGDPAHNLQLSQARAAAVVSALTAQGIDAARLHAKGYGQAQPVADNGSEDGKARNRRVELVKI